MCKGLIAKFTNNKDGTYYLQFFGDFEGRGKGQIMEYDSDDLCRYVLYSFAHPELIFYYKDINLLLPGKVRERDGLKLCIKEIHIRGLTKLLTLAGIVIINHNVKINTRRGKPIA